MWWSRLGWLRARPARFEPRCYPGSSVSEKRASPAVSITSAVRSPSASDHEGSEVEPLLRLVPTGHIGGAAGAVEEEDLGVQRRVEAAVREDAGVERAGGDLVDGELGVLGERPVAERLCEVDVGCDPDWVGHPVLGHEPEEFEEFALEPGLLVEVGPAVTAIGGRETGGDRHRDA